MVEVLAISGFAVFAAAVIYGWRRFRLRRLVLERLGEARTSILTEPRPTVVQSPPTKSPLLRPLRWVPWGLVLPSILILYFLVGFPWPYCISLSVIAGLLGSQTEAFLTARKTAKLETQLADAVDIMVGALGAGAGVADALEAAIQETQSPLKPQLEEILGRIRLGDQAQAVFDSLVQRIPLESFLLFASTLSVHWEVGGSLAPTLSTVGRTIRDRIDMSRRIQSNSSQSQISTLMVLGLTYFIALLVYNNGPEQMREFLATSIGSFLASGSMLLQAVGILWMSYISRIKF